MEPSTSPSIDLPGNSTPAEEGAPLPGGPSRCGAEQDTASVSALETAPESKTSEQPQGSMHPRVQSGDVSGSPATMIGRDEFVRAQVPHHRPQVGAGTRTLVGGAESRGGDGGASGLAGSVLTNPTSDQAGSAASSDSALALTRPRMKKRGSSGRGGGIGNVVGSGGGWSAESAADASTTGKLSRNRKPSSCVNCRKKRLRCNRVAPCDQCERLGEECSWEGAVPLYDKRDQKRESEALRQQVVQLEALVQYYASHRSESDTSLLPYSTASESGPSPLTSADRQLFTTSSSYIGSPSPNTAGHSYPTSSASGHSFSASSSHNTAPLLDLRANDLCEALSHLAIQDIAPSEQSGSTARAPLGQNAATLVKEASVFVSSPPQSPGLSTTRVPSSAHPLRRLSTASRPRQPAPGSSSASWTHQSPRDIPPQVSPITPDFQRKVPTLAEVLALLPTEAQALSSYGYFSGYVSWYSHPIHLPDFERKWAALSKALAMPEGDERNRMIDPFFIATFMGICATGLAMMPVKRAVRDGFDANKMEIVDRWLAAGMMALRCGKFIESPTVESIRATTVLATYGVFMSIGESFGAGMALLGLASQAAISLGLHRDPDRTPGRYSLFEAEDRRRLFHGLLTLCVLASAAVGRTWTIFDLNMIDTMLPLDAHDVEIEDEELVRAGLEARTKVFAETPMTSLIAKMQLAIIGKRIGDVAFGIRPVTHRTVLDFDLELTNFELSLPACYKVRMDEYGALIRPTRHVTVTEMRACMLHVSLAAEFLRLHRPFLVLAASSPEYERSKTQCVYYGKLLLAIFGSPSCSQQPWGGLTSKATAAAVVLAMTCLAFPEHPEVDLLPELAHKTAAQMEQHQTVSSISRKGAAVIRFLLNKVALAQAEYRLHGLGGGKRRRATTANETIRFSGDDWVQMTTPSETSIGSSPLAPVGMFPGTSSPRLSIPMTFSFGSGDGLGSDTSPHAARGQDSSDPGGTVPSRGVALPSLRSVVAASLELSTSSSLMGANVYEFGVDPRADGSLSDFAFQYAPGPAPGPAPAPAANAGRLAAADADHED